MFSSTLMTATVLLVLFQMWNSPSVSSLPRGTYNFCNFFLSGMHLWHMEVPRLEWATAASLHFSHSNVESKPCLWLHHSSQKHQIFNPLSEAMDWTCIPIGTSHVCNPLNHNGNSVIFFFFFGHVHGIWNFLGQGLNLSCSCNLHYSRNSKT